MRSYLKEKYRLRSRKQTLTTVGDLPCWPHDTPLSAKVGTKFRQQVAVAQSAWRRMPSSGKLRRVALVRTHVSEELSLSIIRVHRLLVMANVPSSPILVTVMMGALSSSVTSVLTRTTWRHIPEDILRSHRRENLKSYIALTGWTL
jgi:hypothetical protein